MLIIFVNVGDVVGHETHTYALPRTWCRGHRDPNIHMVMDTGVGVLCGNHVNTAACETCSACDR